MATCAVSGLIQDVSGTVVAGAVIKARPTVYYFSTTIEIVPTEVSTTSSASGTWSLTLIQGASLVISIEYPPNATDSRVRVDHSVTIPATATADFSTLVTETIG